MRRYTNKTRDTETTPLSAVSDEQNYQLSMDDDECTSRASILRWQGSVFTKSNQYTKRRIRIIMRSRELFAERNLYTAILVRAYTRACIIASSILGGCLCWASFLAVVSGPSIEWRVPVVWQTCTLDTRICFV